MILVAVAMFPIVAMLTFAIDVSHWFDYSRNLQNRADAAAFAGGQMLGACLGGSAGSTTNGLQSTAGKWAQLYTGASVGEGSATQSPNLPYSDAAVAASPTAAAGTGNGPGTGWAVTANGYLNNTIRANPVDSPLTLRAGLANINNFWLGLNASDYAPSAAGANTSFTMGPVSPVPTFCQSDPTYDVSDPQCYGQPHGQTSGPCAVGPMVDVKLTQANIPLFVPIFSGLNPTIHAHARVALHGEASSPFVRPIAVADPGSFGCATVRFKNSVTHATIATAQLTETDPTNFVFDNSSTPVDVTMPSNLNTDGGRAYVYTQVFLSAPDENGNCPGTDGQTFDGTTDTGIEAINSYGTGTPTTDQPPRITSVNVGGTEYHGVTLSGTCPAPGDQYFSLLPANGSCKVQPTAVVAFAVPKNDASVTAVDQSTGDTLDLKPDNTGEIWSPNGVGNNFSINDSDGQHPIEIKWQQTSGTINGTACGDGNGGRPAPCTGTFGVQAQAFGACNGCDPPDDSGPIIKSQIRLNTDVAGTTGENSFEQGSTQQLVVTLQLAGIRAQSGAAAPDVVLRFASSTNHQTGLVDCGQGNGLGGTGTPADAYTIYGGCGPSNPFEQPQCTSSGLPCKVPQTGGFMNPLYVYSRGNPTDCSPATDQDYVDWPSGNHQDCVETTPGSRRVNIVCGLVQRITGVTPAQFDASASACGPGSPGTCPANNWPDTSIPGDLRKIDVVLTAPLDLAAADNSPQYWVPIRRFATFYVTGWDPSLFPKCSDNDAYPGKGKLQNATNGAIWGHWINDLDVGGIPDDNPCNPIVGGEPTNCVPTLTR